MKKDLIHRVLLLIALSGILALSAVPAQAQGGQPYYPPAPGHLRMMPLFPVGMAPRGMLPYSWEVGKNRTQIFGLEEYSVGDRAERLIKQKRKELKAEAKAAKRANKRQNQ